MSYNINYLYNYGYNNYYEKCNNNDLEQGDVNIMLMVDILIIKKVTTKIYTTTIIVKKEEITL